MSPLKKGGLTRLVTPGSPSKGQPNTNPFSLFVIPMKQGVSTAYATTYNNPQKSAFVYPIVQHLQANPTIANEWNINEVCFRRVPGENNSRMPSEPGSAYGFYQFVRIFESEEDSNRRSNVEWGKQLAKHFSDFAAAHYQYPKSFKFVRTPEETELPTADTHLMNEDVIKVMDTIYPPSTYSRQEQVDNVQDDFFHFQEAVTLFYLLTRMVIQLMKVKVKSLRKENLMIFNHEDYLINV